MRCWPFFAMVALACLLAEARPCSAASSAAYAIEINLPALRLYLYRQEELVQDFPVAVGKPATPTPVGSFRIVSKQHNPTWYPAGKKPVPPGPRNPLGQWWLGLSAKGYGIHGCADESSIGRTVSKGCIRMHNRDVALLVRYVGPGTPVRIVYEPYAVWQDPYSRQIWLWIGQDIYKRTSLVESALAFLRRAVPDRWHVDVTRTMLANGPAGWIEVPQRIEVLVRAAHAGPACLWQGQIWFPRSLARSLPGGADLASRQDDVSLEELSAAGGESVGWRYDPGRQTVTALPLRLRRGAVVREDGVRRQLGRVMVRVSALADLLGEPAEVSAAPAGGSAPPAVMADATETWAEVRDAHGTGWRARWSEEAWEVVVERDDD